MLKRLLTAVLVLGLIMAFSGTAFTDPTNVPGAETGRTPSKLVYTGSVSASAHRIPTPSLRHSGQGQILETSAIPPRPAPAGVDTNACYEWEGYDPSARYRLELFGSTGPDDTDASLAEQFEVVNYPDYSVEINQVYALIRMAKHWSAGGTGGGLRIRLRIFDDNLGLPGSLLHSEIYTIPTRINAATWFLLPLSSTVAITGARYHVSVGYDPTQAAFGDSLALWVAPNGPGRGTIGYSNVWDQLENSWWQDDHDFVVVPTQCEFYADCFSALPDLGTGSGYIQPTPDNVGWTGGATYNGMGQRFVSATPESITGVDVKHYSLPGYYTGTSTNGLVVQIWNDDGAGNIDNTAGPIYTQNVPGGASLFPNTGIGGSGWNTVPVAFTSAVAVHGPWHVTVKMSSDLPTDGQLLYFFTDPAGNPGPSGFSVGMTAPFSPYWQRGYLNTDWGFDAGYYIRTYRCKDEFSVCGTATAYQFGTTSFLYMDNCNVAPHYGSRNGIAGRLALDKFTRLDKIRFQVLDEFEGDGYPDYQSKIKISVCAVSSDNVSTVLWTDTLDEGLGEITMYPGWTEVVIPGGLIVVNECFVTLEPLFEADGDTEWLYFARERSTDDPSVTLKNGGMHVKLCSDNLWYNNFALLGAVNNATIEADYCSIPPDRWTCQTPSDFMNAGADYARTLHTNVALSDAYCDLTFRWKYVDPQYNVATNRVVNSGPVVFDTIVACAFSSRYRFFNLKDGSIIGEIVGPTGPYYLPTTGINCTPTIAMVTIGGTPKPIMFAGHGNSAGFRVFDAYDLSSWTGTAPTAVPAQLWSINQTNYAAHGFTFPTGYPIHIGATNFTNPIVMTLGSTECVIFNTNDQYIWAAEAATGNRFTGWAGPIIVNGLTYKGLATDGTNLYITNTALLPVYPLGDITCWDAATGVNKWKLSTAAGGGLRGAGAMPDFGNETFVSGLAVDGGKVFTVSTTPEVDDPSGQYGGLFYIIDATTGAVNSTTPTEHRRQDGGLSLTGALMVDANVVVFPGSSRWANSVNAGQLFGYNRFTGAQLWVTSEGAYDADAGHIHDGLLTCEAGETDLAFVTNTNGYLSCFNPVTGDEYFSRRWNNPANVGGALGIAKTGELLVADRQGGLYCLSKNDVLGSPIADRPRLEILDHTPQGNTYGPLPSVIVTIPNVYYNSGCAPLTGNVIIESSSNGTTLGPVAGSSVRSTDIADLLTQASSKLMLMTRPDPSSENYADAMASVRPALNRAAAAAPLFINVGTLPISLNPGDTGDFVLDVHQSLVYRGENVFFAYFQTNDPDYFLDSLTAQPQVRGMIIGGCLLDTARLVFGTGGANWQDVLNVPRYGHYGETDDNWYMSIGGDFNDFYGGFEVYGVSKERIAMNTQDWWSGNGEARAYKSLQGDPNQCNTNCKPALLTAQTFGMITADGSAYTPLVGNMVCATFLDSVQMWAPIDTTSPSGYGAWNWNTTWLTAGTYNTDSTMGLITQRRSIGFTGFPAAMPYLGQVVVDFNKIYFRYATNNGPLNGWRAGEHVDYDVGADTVLHFPTFAAYSACATVPAPGYASRTTGTWGTLKIPYGGGCNSEVYPTLRNAISMEGDQSMNEQTQRGNAYLDSVYTLMGRPAGTYSQGPMRTAPSDQRSHDTWIHHDFANNADTLSFAIAHFGNPTLASPTNVNSMVAPLSKTLNKWVGMDRGDVNNDGALNLADIVYLADFVGTGTFGPIPFATVGDVNIDGATNAGDVTYLVDYYFHYGDCPMSKYVEPFVW